MADGYYNLLGVPKSASEKEIRTAFRRLARQYHPDVNQGDDTSAEKFKEINEAYQVLSDAESRKKYDRYGSNWRNAGQYDRGSGSGASPRSWFNRARQRPTRDAGAAGGFSSMGDMFGDIFGSGGSPFDERPTTRKADVPVTITLEEAYEGASRTVEVPADPYVGTAARRLQVTIPAGAKSGSRVHIGAAKGAGGGIDLTLVVTVKAHPRFERKGDDLVIGVEAPLVDLVLGGEVEIPMITGKRVALKIPAETPNGKVFRLKGKGMPHGQKANAGAHGDELVTVSALLPRHLDAESRRLFEELRELGASAGQLGGEEEE
jgi:DnaJ-class molecular chaperone